MKMFYIIKPVHKYPDILNPQIVLCGFKNFHVHTSGIQIEFGRLHAYLESLSVRHLVAHLKLKSKK